MATVGIKCEFSSDCTALVHPARHFCGKHGGPAAYQRAQKKRNKGNRRKVVEVKNAAKESEKPHTPLQQFKKETTKARRLGKPGAGLKACSKLDAQRRKREGLTPEQRAELLEQQALQQALARMAQR